jgi:predicted transcriptional regulator
MVTDVMQQSTNDSHWLTVLREQGRTIAWLADRTGRPRRSIYGYRRGEARPTAEWLRKASEVLGVEVTA